MIPSKVRKCSSSSQEWRQKACGNVPPTVHTFFRFLIWRRHRGWWQGYFPLWLPCVKRSPPAAFTNLFLASGKNLPFFLSFGWTKMFLLFVCSKASWGCYGGCNIFLWLAPVFVCDKYSYICIIRVQTMCFFKYVVKLLEDLCATND